MITVITLTLETMLLCLSLLAATRHLLLLKQPLLLFCLMSWDWTWSKIFKETSQISLNFVGVYDNYMENMEYGASAPKYVRCIVSIPSRSRENKAN